MFESCKRRCDGPNGRECGFLFRRQAYFLLNQLCHMGTSRMILRQDGLSLARVTNFGLFVADSCKECPLFGDCQSGLETDLTHNPRIYLLPEPSAGSPVLAVSPAEGKINLSIRLESLRWTAPVIQNLIGRFGGIPVDQAEIWRTGADAWLDDWQQTTPPSTKHDRRTELIAALDPRPMIEVEVHADGHRAKALFRPSFVDFSNSTVRIADARRHHVVFADVDAAGFEFHQPSRDRLVLRRTISLAN